MTLNQGKKKLLDQPNAVIKRWVSIRTIRITKPYMEKFIRLYFRAKLTYKERKRSTQLTLALNTTVRELKKPSTKNFKPLETFLNLSLFFLIAEKDMQTVKIDALSHPDEWKRNLSLRVLLLIVCEWNMAKVAPANILKEAYKTAGISQDLIDEMTDAFRITNKAHSKAKQLLVHIRHATIAHRDANSLLQYETITKLDALKVMQAIADFYEGIGLFVKTLPKIIREAGRVSSLIKQYQVGT